MLSPGNGTHYSLYGVLEAGRICLLPSLHIHTMLNVSHLKPFLCGMAAAHALPLLPHIVADPLAYMIRFLLDSHQVQGSTQYLFDWEGNRLEECS